MNMIALNTASTLTMSSLQIAELVEKRHDNVKRTVETLVAKGIIVRPQIEDEQSFDTMGRSRKEAVYRINKRDTYVVVAQLSPEFTARLVDRWQELEQATAVALPDCSNPAAAARAWAEQFEAKQIAQAQVEELKPMAVIGARAAAYEHSLNRFVRTLPGVNTLAIKAHNYLRKSAGSYA